MINKIKPIVSVIVPVYNVEKYLKECVDSILAQTYQNLEIILVDDGSTDLSGKICDEFANAYSDIIKVVHKHNGGASSARNVGLELASGEYLSFIDSDDKILPEMYNDMIDAMEAYNVDVVASDFLPWDAGHTVKISKNKSFTGTSDIALGLLFNWKLNTSACTKLYRRSILDEIRFPVGLTNEDFVFLCKLFLRRHKIHVMDKGYYLYRFNENSVTNILRPSFFDVFKNLEYVASIIPDDLDYIRHDFKYYELTIHIMSGSKIVLGKNNQEYKSWLQKNRAYILNNWKWVIGFSRLNLKWRIKALISFLNISR